MGWKVMKSVLSMHITEDGMSLITVRKKAPVQK